MDVEKFAAATFKSDTRIRFVGIVDNQFHILFASMREGVESVTQGDEDRNFIQLMPPIIVDAVEKMQPVLGKLDNITVRYEKVVLVFFRMEGLVIVVSFNPDVSTPFFSSLSEKMRVLASLYLKQ